MPPAIRIQGLAKSYVLRHESHPPYRMLREVLAQAFSRRRAAASEELFWALKDVDLDIAVGERVGIIGRNGAGKSTLLKIVSRIVEPSAGEVRLRGRVASLLEVGTGFHPELTGGENIYLSGAVLGMRRREIRQKFDAIVAFAEVERFLDTPIKRYSSGMYVRLAFAVAAHLEPEILIVDEVLAVGDAAFQKKCLGTMQRAGQEGRTVLMVSHNMQSILTLCNRGVLLDQGTVAASGSAQEAVDAYLGSGDPRQTEKRWDDPAEQPGNAAVRAQAVRIRPLGQGQDASLTVRTTFEVEIEYELAFAADAFWVGFRLSTAYGDVIFGTQSPPMPAVPGRYRSKCVVPGDLLNNGAYTIDVAFVRDATQQLLRLESVLSFEVSDVAREIGAWLGPISGAVRPRLDWSHARL